MKKLTLLLIILLINASAFSQPKKDSDNLILIGGYLYANVMDISTKTLLNERDTTLISKGIDGLEFYKGNLYGIQNAVRANGHSFRRLLLNSTQDQITGMEIIDSNNPMLNVPLTFCIAGKKAVVIGNSNLQFLNQDKLEFTLTDSTKNTHLLVYELND